MQVYVEVLHETKLCLCQSAPSLCSQRVCKDNEHWQASRLQTLFFFQDEVTPIGGIGSHSAVTRVKKRVIVLVL